MVDEYQSVAFLQKVPIISSWRLMQPTKLLRQMRILFDENFPTDFAALLVGHEASNVHSHGLGRSQLSQEPESD